MLNDDRRLFSSECAKYINKQIKIPLPFAWLGVVPGSGTQPRPKSGLEKRLMANCRASAVDLIPTHLICKNKPVSFPSPKQNVVGSCDVVWWYEGENRFVFVPFHPRGVICFYFISSFDGDVISLFCSKWTICPSPIALLLSQPQCT